MCRAESCLLKAGPQAPAEARQFAGRALENWGLAELRDDVSLLVSELVTNAVQHAGTSARVSLAVANGVLEAAVRDGAGHLTLGGPRPHAVETDEGGRGLHLLDQLTPEWGVSLRGKGKEVWFRVPVSERWPWRSDCRCDSELGTGGPGSGRQVLAMPGDWDRA